MIIPFEDFMSQLQETNFRLKDFTDFEKVKENTHLIEIKLNTLNYLLGKQDIDSAITELYEREADVFSVLPILIAVRERTKKTIKLDGSVVWVDDHLNNLEDIKQFIKQTGLADIFRNKNVKNLVDYVFGVEVGLDTNARKNRSGDIMADLIADRFRAAGIPFRAEVYSNEFPEINTALGSDRKRFDFVIETRTKKYLLEVNFYSGGGSKLNEVARAYSELAPIVNAQNGFEFIWITDGKGWDSARSKLQQAYTIIPSVYNLTNLSRFINMVQADL